MKNQAMELSKEQIQILFDFVKSKRVRYKDIQLEIVDHLASGIENKISEDPKKAFTKALDEVYGGFPITGFAQLVQEKSNSMDRFWRTRLWSYIGQYFTLPKIVLTLSIFLIIFLFLSNFPVTSNVIFLPFSIIGVLALLFFYKNGNLFDAFNFGISSAKKSEYLIVESYYKHFAVFVNLLILPIYLLNRSFIVDTTTEIVLMSLIATFFSICLHSTIFVFPKLLIKEVQQNYKHLNISYLA